MVCTGPINYGGMAAVQTEIDNFKAALQGIQPTLFHDLQGAARPPRGPDRTGVPTDTSCHCPSHAGP